MDATHLQSLPLVEGSCKSFVVLDGEAAAAQRATPPPADG